MLFMSSAIRFIAVAALVFGTLPVHAHDRRVLRPNESIADHVRADGQDDASRFTITAEVHGLKETSSFTSEKTLSVDVIKALPAITSDTSIQSDDGTSVRFGDTSNMLDTLLVSDTATSTGRSSLTILAVDPVTGETQGVLEQTGSKSMKIHQGGDGGAVTASEEEKMEMPAWECGVGKEGDTLFHRELEEDHHHDHEHNEDGHGHHHHLHGHHDHDEFDPSISAIENLSRSLRGTKINPMNKQRILDSTVPYSYQVDLFLEIDNAFITMTGGGARDAAGITLNAYNYINALVTAANVIYESEIDTHLHVNTIKLSTLYDGASNVYDALGKMRSAYGGDSWHTEGVDVQHALLGKDLGGGVAYIGVICNANYGFGLTSGLQGDFKSLDQRVVWDLKAFMHEIGHNFSSGHTHDTNYYSPAIDTCGSSCPATPGSRWSTLMSYCQGCPGNWENLMYSFGGIYDGPGPKSEAANWINKPELEANYDNAHKSVEPHREAHKMYSHVSSRGTCVAKPVPPVTVTYATYDSTLGVPKCATASESCSSGNLLDGRAGLGPAEQGHSPNTLLNSCSDGTSGAYHADESIDVIKVTSTAGRLLTVGKVAEIETTVYSYDPSADFADFYYTSDPSNPTWVYIGTGNPGGKGIQSIKMQYTLPPGKLQAVRVVFRWNGSASTSNPFVCPSSGYDEVDDIVFIVSSGATPNPTSSPTSTPTSNPTVKPTTIPTNPPTRVPTKAPSEPTLRPTRLPTSSPSFATDKPTTLPTKAPVPSPTSNPTTSPTDPLTCYNARKVRLEATTGQQIQLFEFQAFSSGINVARQGIASQSSDWNSRFVASQSIDGKLDSFSHTKDSNAFLEIDLGSQFLIEEVVLINRWCRNRSDPTECLCRLSSANLLLIGEDGSVISKRQLGNTCGMQTISNAFISDAGC